MAGGSADGAAALVACDALWDAGLAAQRPGGPGRRPRGRRPLRPARRHGDRLRPRGRAGPRARTRPLPLGLRPQRRRPLHAGDLRRVRPAPGPGAGARALAVRADDDGAALRRRRGARPGADQRPAGGGADPAAGPERGARHRDGVRRPGRRRVRVRSDGRVPGRGPRGGARPGGGADRLRRGLLGQARHRAGRGRPRPPGQRRDRCRLGAAPARRPAARCPGRRRRRWRRPRRTARAGRATTARPERPLP